jgi:prolipoprotein diacylglyceryltransferase
VIEFYRGDDRGMAGMFSPSPLISLVLVPLSVAMLWWLRRRQRPRQPAGPVVRRRPQSASA